MHASLVDLFDVESKESGPKPVHNFGKILKSWLTVNNREDGFIQACQDFCKKQLSAGLWIQDQCKSIQELQNDLKEIEMNNPLVGRLPFANFLVAQMQHLIKYPMMIDSILKKTDAGSEEFGFMNEVKARFSGILVEVNSAVKTAQNQEKYFEIVRNLGYRMEYSFDRNHICVFHRILLVTIPVP